MKYSIDRIENGIVILVNEKSESITIPEIRFTFTPAEGMVVSVREKCIRRLKKTEEEIKNQNNKTLRKLLDRK